MSKIVLYPYKAEVVRRLLGELPDNAIIQGRLPLTGELGMVKGLSFVSYRDIVLAPRRIGKTTMLHAILYEVGESVRLAEDAGRRPLPFPRSLLALAIKGCFPC